MVPGLFKLPEKLVKNRGTLPNLHVFGVACVVTAVVCCGVRDAVGITRGIGSIAVLPIAACGAV